MVSQFETSFMNDLSPSLRRAAGELYLKENIDSLVESRLNNISEKYQNEHTLSDEQWRLVLNALILTKISQLNLGNNLTSQQLMQINYMVKIALNMQDATVDEILTGLEDNAKIFSIWYKNLIGRIKS